MTGSVVLIIDPGGGAPLVSVQWPVESPGDLAWVQQALTARFGDPVTDSVASPAAAEAMRQAAVEHGAVFTHPGEDEGG
jgi:hypothetical protein